jgi:hypothetical protein
MGHVPTRSGVSDSYSAMTNFFAVLWSKNRTLFLSICLTFLTFVVCAALPAEDNSHSAANDGAVQVQMHNVMYHYTDGISVHLRDVGGKVVPTTAGQMPIFDDKKSFTIEIAAAEIAMTPQSLANILNSNVFSGQDSPLKDIQISIDKGLLKIKGKLHRKGDIGFETDGVLSATPDGKIRLHAEKIKALHLPVKGLMDLIGLDIADLIKNGKVQGVQTEKDDLILDPGQILPPPRISGKVTSIRLEANNIVQTFGDPKKYTWAKVPAQNYMAYRGNHLQFGKLIMNDTDLILIDPDPKDPFDFYLDHYMEELSAGYTKITPQNGLRVYMVDFNKLKNKTGSAAQKIKKPTAVSKAVF